MKETVKNMTIPIIDSRDLPNNWRIVDDKGNFRERGLPFRFPYVGAFSQALAEWFVRVYSEKGDVILDPFSGRGSVAMQALWNDRHVVCNDMSPYSNTLCHSVLWTPRMTDTLQVLKKLEDYVNNNRNKIDEDYVGKGTTDDVAKLYHPSTFHQIIRLRNVLINHKTLLGRGFGPYTNSINADAPEGSKKVMEGIYTYEHEIIMFLRMVLSQLVLHSSKDMGLNGIKTRGTDNTNVKALLRYYESLGESPQRVNIFDNMEYYIEKMDLDGLGIRDRVSNLNRTLISCDARHLNLPDKCIDGVVTSPPYFDVLNYGMANWLRIWSIEGVGDPLVRCKIVEEKIEKLDSTSEAYGKKYDKATDSTGSTVANPQSYSTFTGQYLNELYRVLKDDAFAIIVVGDYGNKKKMDAWRLVSDRASIFGFKVEIIIMDELNKEAKSSTQFQSKFDGGKNDKDVCVVLYKGNYKRKNNPEDINFQWASKMSDNRQKNIEEAWGF